MKKISKLLSLTFVILFAFAFIRINANASEVTTKTDDGAYYYTTVSETKTKVSESTTWIENSGKTKNGDQLNHIFVADFNANENIKIATWACSDSTNYGFSRTNLMNIALDYQKKNPGWIVLAGVNADQYYFKYGTNRGINGSACYYPQSYYPLVSNGDNWFVINPYGSCNNVVGFKNDGSANPLVYGERSISGFYLHVYDREGNELGKFLVNDLNMETLGENQTTIISPVATGDKVYQDVTKESSNGFYVIENADLAYAYNSTTFEYTDPANATNAFFGKGTINKIYSKSCYLRAGQFAIETTNSDLKALLKKGLYVKAQYEFDEGFAGIEEATGYHTVQRSNGKDCNVANSYNTRCYPRSVFGCDKDGKVYLITCDGKNSSPLEGMYAEEMNALCKYYGITDAFQCDGGGSVTAIVRDANGELQYAMDPIETDYRWNLSATFIVMKVPTADISVSECAQTSATLTVDVDAIEEKYDKAYLKIYNNDYNKYVEIIDGKVSLDDLTVDTEYTYQLALESGGKTTDTLLKGTFRTDKNFSELGNICLEKTDENYKITISYTDSDAVLSSIGVVIDGKYHRGILENGVATITLDKDVSDVILFDIRMECNFQGSTKAKDFANFSFDASLDLYVEYIMSRTNEFFNELFG